MSREATPSRRTLIAVTSVVTGDVWDLSAAPGTLEEMAQAWRQVKDAMLAAQSTVDTSAQQVFDGEAWTGQTADSYNGHRLRVTGDLGTSAASAASVAETLEYLAGVLRFNQELLAQERARLAGVRVTGDGAQLTFHPADEAQTDLVQRAVSAAREIRSRVDDEIAVKTAVFASAHSQLEQVSDAWRPRTVGMLNLNIGQGYENSPHNSGGTDRSDLREIAQLIANADVDIVTMQEVFGSDVERLEQELRELTGDEWTIHFGEASEKVYWSDGYRPIGMHEPFGNAIAVRHDDAVSTSDHTDTIKLDVEGSNVTDGSGPPTGTTTTTVPGTPPPPPPEQPITDGEGRAATEVHVTFNN